MIKISKKKQHYAISKHLRKYLMSYDRERKMPIAYTDLTRYQHSAPLHDEDDRDTLWETVYYSQDDMMSIYHALKTTYSILKTDGDLSVIEDLYIDRIDLCIYGNSKPYRVRIVNRLNDNFDYFYIKRADASRVYGLELEHILSPNHISYIVDGDTLIEEHIIGIPGDMFIKTYLHSKTINKRRLAKEFVKFNERCLVRLLGDMHSSNFVVEITPDFEEVHYRIRAIDFDQQSYDGRRFVYMPQYFESNKPILEICSEVLSPESVRQYQKEERSMMATRLRAARYRIKELGDAVMKDNIAPPENVELLRSELGKYYNDPDFKACTNMGAVVKASLKVLIKQAANSKMMKGF
jgi:hypothetical protein